MDLRGSRRAQKLYDPCARCAAHNGVVDQHDALAAHDIGDGVELNAHLILAALLARGDEGSANVLVLDEAKRIRDARLA